MVCYGTGVAALPRIDNAKARAIFLDRHGLADPPSGPGQGIDLRRCHVGRLAVAVVTMRP